MPDNGIFDSVCIADVIIVFQAPVTYHKLAFLGQLVNFINSGSLNLFDIFSVKTPWGKYYAKKRKAFIFLFYKKINAKKRFSTFVKASADRGKG